MFSKKPAARQINVKSDKKSAKVSFKLMNLVIACLHWRSWARRYFASAQLSAQLQAARRTMGSDEEEVSVAIACLLTFTG